MASQVLVEADPVVAAEPAYANVNALLKECHFARQRVAPGRLREFAFELEGGGRVALELHEKPGAEIGSITWGGAEAMCAALAAAARAPPPPLRRRGVRVLELGAGTGLAGLFCSRAFGAAVTLTDQAPLLPLLRANAARSGHAHRSSPVAVRELAWGADRQDDDEAGPEAGPELVLLADVVYDERSVAPLLAEIRRVLACDLAAAPRCECLLLAYKRRDVAAERAFFTQLGGVGVATLRVMTKGHREDAAAELRGSPGPWTPSTEARLAAGSTEVFELLPRGAVR